MAVIDKRWDDVGRMPPSVAVEWRLWPNRDVDSARSFMARSWFDARRMASLAFECDQQLIQGYCCGEGINPYRLHETLGTVVVQFGDDLRCSKFDHEQILTELLERNDVIVFDLSDVRSVNADWTRFLSNLVIESMRRMKTVKTVFGRDDHVVLHMAKTLECSIALGAARLEKKHEFQKEGSAQTGRSQRRRKGSRKARP